MTCKQAAIYNILTSLLFAGLIILADYFSEGMSWNDNITGILIAVWLIPFTYFSYKGSKK